MVRDWVVLALGSAVFAALTAILAKMGIEGLSSNAATLIRTVVVLTFVTLLVGLRREWPHPQQLTQRNVLFLGLSGLATGASWLCYYRALQSGPASLVAPLDKLSLPLTLLLAMWMLGEHVTAGQWLGAILMSGGALLIAFK